MRSSAIFRVWVITTAIGCWQTGATYCQEGAAPWEHADEELGIQLTLPDASWKKPITVKATPKSLSFPPMKK